MEEQQVCRKLFLGFVQVYILHYAKQQPVFGLWVLEELKKRGYSISAGTLYPLLHHMETSGLLERQAKVVDGKVRKYYTLTQEGEVALTEACQMASELLHTIGGQQL